MKCTLILQTELINDNVEITLTQNVESSIFEKSKICGRVYSDMSYSAKLDFDEKIQNVKFYINDTLIPCSYFNGKLYFKDNTFLENKIFINYFGYVSITICIETIESRYEFYSNYLDVAIRDNISSDHIRKMIKYISENSQKYLVAKEEDVKDFADVGKSENKNIYTEISMLENIIFEYEINFNYFRACVKYTINNNYIIDDFEKLKEIKNETIQYIISNPQHLMTVNYNTGIRHNEFNLQPKKTLINKNIPCYNIYENKIVIGFLKYIFNLISDKIRQLESQFNNVQQYAIRSEYISLSNEVYKEISKSLNKYKIKLGNIKKKVQNLYIMYKQILKCEELSIDHIPKPSSIFIKTQHYRRIYKVIKDWFDSGNYNFKKEKMILTFQKASQIYEYYVLLKINNYIAQNEYSLKSANIYPYHLKKNAKYKNTKFENTFIFKKGNTSITVYYQPVIYSNYRANDIGLFRNNGINFEGEESQYYTPDYIIKITQNELSEYIILDAKWATINSVINHSFKKIVYKYIFSISPINRNDKINKIWIINGKEMQQQQEYLYNFYNSKFETRNNELIPSVKILTLNPIIDEYIEKENLDQLLNMI